MKYILKAIDTFEFGSEGFIVGEYESKEKAIKSIERRKITGDVFYKYIVEDDKGVRHYTN